MKRPELEYIGNHQMKDKYIEQLEKYCDCLEDIISKEGYLVRYENETERFKKEFDEALKLIRLFNQR